MENTEISWCNHTYNHWIGCAKISAGCRFCYAEAFDNRFNSDDQRRTSTFWGRLAPRRATSPSYRARPYTWNRKAAKTGIPVRVFTASLSDVFEDHPMLPAWRAELFETIEKTPHLRWMMLTKRIDLVEEMTASVWGKDWPKNAWLGTSIEHQKAADERLPILLNLAGPAERFVSAEPLLKRTVVGDHLDSGQFPLSLLIAGGESGANARYDQFDEAARSLRDEAAARQVPFHFKQWGNAAAFGQLPIETRTSLIEKLGRLPDFDEVFAVGKKRSGRLLDGRTHNGVVASWAAEVGLEVAA